MSIKRDNKEQDKVMDAAQDVRAWRVAQLTAQLAKSDALRHDTRPDFLDRVPVEERDDRMLAPDDKKLDWWFLSLLRRADWLLEKSEEMNTAPWLFAEFFEGGKRYSFNEVAKAIKTHEIRGWGDSSVSEKVKQMVGLMLDRCAEHIAHDVLWLSMAEKGPMPLDADKDMIKRIRDILAVTYDTVDELFDEVVAEAVYQCGVIQGAGQAGESWEDGVFYYHVQAGSNVEKVSVVPRSIAEAHELAQETECPVDRKILPHVMMCFRFNQAVRGLSVDVKAGSGGKRQSKGLLARDMFHLASDAGLPAEYWSAPRM